MSKRFDVVSIGLACLDKIYLLERFPEPDKPTEILEYLEQGGGPAGTATVTLAKLGAKTALICKVGNDEAGKQILYELRSYGIDLSNVIVEEGSRSPLSIVLVHKQTGKRSFLFGGPRVSAIRPDELDRTYIIDALALHTDNTSSAGIQAMRWAKEAGMLVSVDSVIPSPDAEWLEYADILISPVGGGSFEEAIEEMRRLEICPIRIVTAGEEGCWGIADAEEFTVPAHRVEVVDTTGCRDVFHGAFPYGVLQGWEVERSARFASVTSALKAKRLGGRTGIPTLEEVLREMA